MNPLERLVQKIHPHPKVDPKELSTDVPPHLQIFIREMTWRTNPAPDSLDGPLRLHLGCADNLFKGFVNIDFLPESPKVLSWNLLNRWPDELRDQVECAFSECLVEHFFFDEQVYLLSQMNLALAQGGVFRVLMPRLDSLFESGRIFDRSTDFLAQNFGVRTGADAINLGMRFGGHRWLHDPESLASLAELCGFEAIPTTCEESTVPELCNRNLRDEGNSLSFAHDLKKVTPLQEMRIQPLIVKGAEEVGELVPDQPMYVSTSNDAQVYYDLPEELNSDQIVVLTFRGGNLSQFREHNYSEAYLVQKANKSLPIDSSMLSSLHSSMVTGPLIGTRHQGQTVKRIRFDPSRERGDYFTVGPLEIVFRS